MNFKESVDLCYMNFAKFLTTPFLQNTSGRLLLIFSVSFINVHGFLEKEIFNNLNSTNQLKWNMIKVSEYPFKENKNTLKIIQALLYTHFYNISLNVLRPNFLNICNLPISHFPSIRKIKVKVGPKTNYFSNFMSSCTDRIVVFNIFFSLIFSQPRDKQNCARDFPLFKYFLNNLLLTVFMQNGLSKLVKLLQ